MDSVSNQETFLDSAAYRQKFMEQDALSRHLGISLDEVRPGYAKATLVVTPTLLNGVGVTHGGAVFTLADIVLAAASNSHGTSALGLNVNISYMKATRTGETLTAIAREEKMTRKIGFYRMEVRDSTQDLVAVAEGMVYRK
ncbi:PaaI family thioesterase [Heliophilum fasciatum]|uniref:Acyl-CoA thioesterase n=1 Tax=Heliophilum fasciatum TaxID=35700 RepID=A0A4R2RLH5_9FIRM|nr:PaaI family thioesterase [Heliophilum fasciatum]MCW2278206.1 acyl-CoA thioesterase [Heliophilum fasciatum]TCP63973.1 acyl-CoA thioesterase [Heliophilum fasciatum]